MSADNEHVQSREEEQTDPTNRVRQGVTGHNVRYVLFWSIAALLAAYTVVIVFWSGTP